MNEVVFTYLGDRLFKKQNYRNNTLINEARYLYDGGGLQLAQERDGSNNVVNEYAYGLGLPGGIGGLLHLNQGGTPHSYVYDGKGNVTALLDGQARLDAYQYDPFGQTSVITGVVNQPMQFSTKPYDPDTGLSFYGYRFYSPGLGAG